MEQNSNFIYKCEICGKEDYCMSKAVIKANYGSKYDGATLTLSICGDCADKIFETVKLTSETEHFY